jgi:hypothetical protein
MSFVTFVNYAVLPMQLIITLLLLNSILINDLKVEYEKSKFFILILIIYLIINIFVISASMINIPQENSIIRHQQTLLNSSAHTTDQIIFLTSHVKELGRQLTKMEITHKWSISIFFSWNIIATALIFRLHLHLSKLR